MDLRVEAREVEQLVQDTEGWPVGVRLAAVARHRDRRDASAPPDGAAPDDTDIADYLREEWLSGLTDEEVEFLTHVSILDWMSSHLCDHVLDRPGAGSHLQRIHSRRRIVIPLD